MLNLILLCITAIIGQNICGASHTPAHSVIAASNPTASYTLTHPPYNPGFFSVFNTVLGALNYFDTAESCRGLEVDFEGQGLYYDPAHGNNWWNYYFEPIKLTKNDTAAPRRFLYYEKINLSLSAEFNMSRERGYELIQKYIQLKPSLRHKLEHFVETNFKGAIVIGVHYRGTDKKSEAPPVAYTTVKELITAEIASEPHAKIFVATDEQPFLRYMHKKFPGRVIALDAVRSEDGKPVHTTNINNGYTASNCYKKGEDAVLDCILLSRCSKLYKMASNLSDTSLKFNPSIPTIHLNQSFSEHTVRDDYDVANTLNIVLSLLDSYEKHESQGFTPHFPMTDASNWWDRLFEQFSVGEEPRKTKIIAIDNNLIGTKNLLSMTPSRAHELLTKYIKIKPSITASVDAYAHSNFEDSYVVGVHYIKQPAGIIEVMQPSIDPHHIINKLTEIIQHAPAPVKLFLVTEDAEFVDTVRNELPAVTVLHNTTEKESSPEEKHILPLKTCLLLSKTNTIIGTSSQLFKLVSQFNPTIKIMPLDTWRREKA